MAASPTQPARISILLRLYPRDWRARYSDEFAALLADTALTPARVLDIAIGALDARWSSDYPSDAGDDRKVRRPMLDRLAALLTAGGGIYFAALMAFVVLASPPESSQYIAAMFGIPVAMAALALGIAGLLARTGWDAVGRALALAASVLAAGITVAILYLFLADDWEGWGLTATLVLFSGFAVATGLLGLRLTLLRDRLAGVVLLAAGAIASAAWLLVWLQPGDQGSLTALNFGIVTVAWGAVGLLRLRSPAPIATTA